MGASDSRERAIADSQFGGGSTTWAPATWFLGISTTTPNDDGTGFTEPTGGAYARVSVTNNATNFPAATTSAGVTTKANGAIFKFTDPTGSWGQLIYYGWFTSATINNGVVLPEYTNPLDTAITVQSGNTPVQFDIGQLVMPFD